MIDSTTSTHAVRTGNLATITIVAGGLPPADHRAVIAALVAQGSVAHRTRQDATFQGASTTGAPASTTTGIGTARAAVSAWRAAGIAEATTHFQGQASMTAGATTVS